VSRKILAIGGGGFMMEDGVSPIDAYIRDLTGRSNPRVCFISTPSGDLPDHIDKFYATYTTLGCETSHLAFFRLPSRNAVSVADFARHLLAQDAIFVGGGNTKSAMAVWREWAVDEALRAAWIKGVLLAGMSAGAMCWFEAGLTDTFWGADYRPLKCLGLLPGACGVHYSSDPQRRASLHQALKLNAVPASIAIDDHAAVLFEGIEIDRVVSWRHRATAYRVGHEKNAVIETPMPAEFIDDRKSYAPTGGQPR
jgi:dipeptidase E